MQAGTTVGNMADTKPDDFFESSLLEVDKKSVSEDPISLTLQERSRHILELLDSLDQKSDAEILDLGCGAGLISVSLMKRGFSVTAIDNSELMINKARFRCTQAGFECTDVFSEGDAEHLDFPDDSFDVIISTGMIENLKWDRWALQEIHRVLRPGGHLIMTVPGNTGLSRLTDVYPRISDSMFNAGLPGNGKHRSISTSTGPDTYVPSRFRRLLAGVDLEVVRSRHYGSGPSIFQDRLNKLSTGIDSLLVRYDVNKLFPGLSVLGRDRIVHCRKKDKAGSFRERSIFANFDKRMRLFRSENKAFSSRRELWLKKNPRYSSPDLLAFEPSAYTGKKVLVLSPHPDDEIIGCGGTLIRLLAEGALVTVIQLTDGSSTCALENSSEEEKKVRRLEEAKVVAECLGVNELVLFGEEESRFTCSDEIVKKLSEVLVKLEPGLIFVPFVNDPHKHHVTANKILRESLKSCPVGLRDVDIFSYEVWSLVPPNSYCVIDEQFDNKASLLMKYRTGMKVIDYVQFCENLNAGHAHNLTGRDGFVEVFFRTGFYEYLELTSGL